MGRRKCSEWVRGTTLSLTPVSSTGQALALTLALSHDGRGDWIPAYAGMTVAVCVVRSYEV